MHLLPAYANSAAMRLAGEAAEVLRRNPGLLTPVYDGTMELRAPLPKGYERRMNSWATELRARVTRDGLLFEITEWSDSVSGGWMASCIPPGLCAIFLTAWLSYTQQPKQFELF